MNTAINIEYLKGKSILLRTNQQNYYHPLLLLLLSHFSVSYSEWPHRRQPTRLPHPWDSPSKSTGVGCHFLRQCMKLKSESEVTQSCPTLSDPMDCSLPGSSIHGIFPARVLEWGAIAFYDTMHHSNTISWNEWCLMCTIFPFFHIFLKYHLLRYLKYRVKLQVIFEWYSMFDFKNKS